MSVSFPGTPHCGRHEVWERLAGLCPLDEDGSGLQFTSLATIAIVIDHLCFSLYELILHVLLVNFVFSGLIITYLTV